MAKICKLNNVEKVWNVEDVKIGKINLNFVFHVIIVMIYLKAG